MRGGRPALSPQALAGKDDQVLTEIVLDGVPGTPMPPWRFELSRDEAAWMIARLRRGGAVAGHPPSPVVLCLGLAGAAACRAVRGPPVPRHRRFGHCRRAGGRECQNRRDHRPNGDRQGGLGDLSHASAVFSRDGRYAFVFGRDGGLNKVDLLQAKLAGRVVQAGNSIGGAISQDGALVGRQLRAGR